MNRKLLLIASLSTGTACVCASLVLNTCEETLLSWSYFIATLHYMWWVYNISSEALRIATRVLCHLSYDKSAFLSVLVLFIDWNFHCLSPKFFYGFNDRLHFILDSGIWKSQLLVFQMHVRREKVGADQEQSAWPLLNKLELLLWYTETGKSIASLPGHLYIPMPLAVSAKILEEWTNQAYRVRISPSL